MAETAKITWDDSITQGVTNHKIYRDDVSIGVVGLGVELFYDTSTESGATYKYEVQAINSIGESIDEVDNVNVFYITIPGIAFGIISYEIADETNTTAWVRVYMTKQCSINYYVNGVKNVVSSDDFDAGNPEPNVYVHTRTLIDLPPGQTSNLVIELTAEDDLEVVQSDNIPLTTTGASTNLTPIMTNFRIEDATPTRVYFDTPLGSVAGIDFNDFMIEGKTISGVDTTDNYFTVTEEFIWHNVNTIRKEGTDTTVYNFTLQYITNNIAEPVLSRIRYANATGSGAQDGLTEENAFNYNAGMADLQAGTLLYMKAGTGTTLGWSTTNGTEANPIRIVGYQNTPGDTPKHTFARDITFDDTLMPYFPGGVDMFSHIYTSIENIQAPNFEAESGIYMTFRNCYSKGASLVGFNSSNQSSPTNSINNRWIDCWSGNADNSNWRVAGSHCLIDGCYSATEGDPGMDYAFSIYGHNEHKGNHVIRRCTINADYLDSHSGHGYSLKPNDGQPIEHCLVEDSTCLDNKSPVQLRHSECRYNVIRNVTAEWSGNEGASSTWEGFRIVGASYNSIENCNFKNMEYPIYFLDSGEDVNGADSGNNNTFKNCIFSNDLNQVLAWFYIRTVTGTTKVPNNNRFINCTFDSNGTADLFASAVNNTGVGNVIENSIILDTPSEFLSSTYDPGFSFANNDFFGCGTWADSYIGSDGNFEVDLLLDSNYQPQADFSTIDVPRIDGVYYGKNGNERQDPTTVGSVLSAEEIPSQATLLFKSGMENPVIIHALDYDPLNYGYRYLQGSDVPPYSWGDGSITGDDPFGQMIPSYDMGSAGVHVLGVEKELSIQEFVTINGYDGNPTRVLRQTMEGDVNVALQQCPFQLNRIKAIPNKTYLRWYHRYDSLDTLTNDTGAGSNRMLWQYKSELWYDGTDPPPNSGVRTSLTLIGTNDGTGKLYWLASSDIALTGGHPENSLYSISTTNEPDPSMGLNVDGWNLMEVIITWGSGTDGGIVFRLNNVEVFNITGVKTISVDDTLLQFLTLWQFYGGKYGTISEQWLDGVEIWDDDPQLPYTPPVNNTYGDNLFDISLLNSLATGVVVVGQTVELSDVAGGGTNLFTQSSFLEIGKTYKIDYEISNRSSGGVQIIAPFATTTESIDGAYSYEDIAADVFFRMRCSSTATGTMTLSNISIKEKL